MPFYEYYCNKCGHKFEVFQHMDDPELQTHEFCGGLVKRLLSPPALVFKGSGFYETDYKKKQ